jgi:hypothetical protein
VNPALPPAPSVHHQPTTHHPSTAVKK